MVLENTVLAPSTVVPPYTVFAGNPGRCIGRLPPTFDMIMNEHTHAFYAAFKPEKSLKGSLRAPGRGPSHRQQGASRSHTSSRSARPAPKTAPKTAPSASNPQ